MGRAPCCDKTNVKKGPWSPEEDEMLKSFIDKHGTEGNWIALPQKIGLKRCGKSCRLRWLNYLRPNIRHGCFSAEEDSIICKLFIAIGSRWSIIAAHLPGRTDNDIKNHWNTKLKTRILGKNRKNNKNRHASSLNQAMTRNASHQHHHHAASHYTYESNSASSCHEDLNSITFFPSFKNYEYTTNAEYDVKFKCSGSGFHRVQVAPSLTVPQAFYTSPLSIVMTSSSSSFENMKNDGTLEEGFCGNNSLMGTEGLDFLNEISGFINENACPSESICWDEMNTLVSIPVNQESIYGKNMYIVKGFKG